jgi:hypothetical protein
MRRAIRIWGVALIVLGIVFLLEAWLGIKEPFVSDLIVIGSIFIGQLLPLPNAVEERLRRWGLVTKIGIIVVALALYALAMLALNRLTGLNLDYAPAIVFFLIGLVLLSLSQIRWRSAPEPDSTPTSE